MNANLDQLVTGKVVTAVLLQAIVFLEKRHGQEQESNQVGGDRISTNCPSSDPSMCPGNSSLARPLAESSSLHELSMKDRLKTYLYSELPTAMNTGIYMNEACTVIAYTLLMICT